MLVLAAIPAVSAAPVEIVPGVRLLRGAFVPGSQPDGNTVIVDAPDGLVVVDTGRHAAHTRGILDYAKAAGRPVVAVVNTHWHLDHISGNAAVRAANPGARVYASGALEEALGGFLARYRTQLERMLETTPEEAQRASFEAEIARIDSGAKLAPDVVIAAAGARSIGGRAFRVGLETDAVTAGDVWLLDEERGVLIAGDLVTLPAPLLDTACPARWKASLDGLAALEFDLLVPGHGAALTKAQFEAYRLAFGALLACAGGETSTEACIDGWMAATATLTDADPVFARSLMAYYVDLLRGGTLACP